MLPLSFEESYGTLYQSFWSEEQLTTRLWELARTINQYNVFYSGICCYRCRYLLFLKLCRFVGTVTLLWTPCYLVQAGSACVIKTLRCPQHGRMEFNSAIQVNLVTRSIEKTIHKYIYIWTTPIIFFLCRGWKLTFKGRRPKTSRKPPILCKGLDTDIQGEKTQDINNNSKQ